jgi:LDH2 family malate/lactate/ureidoglycolate dehydrogenase
MDRVEEDAGNLGHTEFCYPSSRSPLAMSQQNEALSIKRQLSIKECRSPERWPAAKKPGRPRAPRATDAPIRKLREQGVGMHAIRQKLGCGMGEFSRGAAASG